MESCTDPFKLQSSPLNTNIEGGIDSVHINGVSVLSGLNLGKCKGFLSPATRKSVCNNEVSVLSGCP